MKITNQIRLAVIFCAAILILSQLAYIIDSVFNLPSFKENEKLVNNLILFFCGSFIIYVFSVYSRMKGIKNLANVFLVLLALNIITVLFNMFIASKLELNPKLIVTVYKLINLVKIILLVTIIVNASQSFTSLVKGLQSIKGYAITLLIANLVGLLVSLVTFKSGASIYLVIFPILFIIPYIFVIIFGTQIKEDTI
ncbi:MAG: hypothetical protein JXB00_12255 [Bacteroidales bacterium]|nr:hypothetical protein [Bacteroidales bacterium]